MDIIYLDDVFGGTWVDVCKRSVTGNKSSWKADPLWPIVRGYKILKPHPSARKTLALQHAALETSAMHDRYALEALAEEIIANTTKEREMDEAASLFLALIADESMPQGKWPLGRAIEAHHGKDSIFRCSTVFLVSFGSLSPPFKPP